MDLGTAVAIVRNGILNILVISAPVLLIGMGVGLVVSIFPIQIFQAIPNMGG
jgi:flagellar biosynthesis protein FliQ